MSAPAIQATGTPTAGELLRSFPAWMKKNIGSTLISAVSGGVMGYISNVWLMAVKYEGSQVPAGAAAAGEGNLISGGLFWALASSLVFGIAGYWKSVGTKKFIEDLKGLPGVLASLFKRDGKAGQVHLLWGAATALLASVVISPAIGGILAIGILLAAPSVIGNIVSSLIFRIWSSLIRRIAPTRKHQTTGILSMTVGLIGAAAALAVTFLVTGMVVKLILAVVCAGVALLLSRQKPPAGVMVVMLVLVGMVLAQILSGGVALADDGGWIECGKIDDTISEHFEQWLTNCPGTALVLILGLLGAGPAAVFAPFGWFLGNFAGSLAGGRWPGGRGPGTFHSGPGHDYNEAWENYQRARRNAISGWIRQLIDDPAFGEWRRLHPEFGPGEPSNAEFEAYMRWRHEQGLEDPPLSLPQEPRFEPVAVEPVEHPGDIPVDAMFGPDGPSPLEIILGVEGDPFDPNDPSIEELLFGGEEPSDVSQAPPGDVSESPVLPPDPLRERFENVNAWNPNVPLDSSVWNAMENLSNQVKANGGKWTPEMVATLQGIENAQGVTSNNHLTQIKGEHAQHSKEGMDYIHEQNRKALAAEENARQIAAQIEKQEQYIRNHMDNLPTGQWGHVNDMLGRFGSGGPNSETLNNLKKLSGVVFENRQAQHGQEKAGELNWADYMAAGEQTARTTQKATIAAQIVLAPFAVPATLAGIARLGVGNLAMNAVEGAGVGYTEGGVRGMIVETARRTLPVNTLEAAYNAMGNALHPNDPRYKGAGVGGIALGFVQDLGNALSLAAGANGIKNLGRIPPELPVDTSAIRKLNGDIPPATPKTPADAEWLKGRAQGQKLADDFKDLQKEVKALEAAGNVESANRARQKLQEKVIEINGNYQAKATLKGAPSEVQQAYTEALNPVLKQAQEGTVDVLNASGIKRGNRPLTVDDVVDLRNAKSAGSVPMDRDLAVNQMAERKLLEALENTPPNSYKARELKQLLDEHRAANQFTKNGKPVRVDEIHGQMENAYKQSYNNSTKTPTHPDGQWNKETLGAVTHKHHGEAYVDLNALKNKPGEYPLNPRTADQTGSVTSYKAYENPHNLKPGDAVQETARGTAKDINTKLEPLLIEKGATPQAYQRMNEMKDFLNDVGAGKILPSQAEAMAQSKFGTNIRGLAEQVDSNITAAIKQSGITPVPGGFRPLPGPGVGAAVEHTAVAARTGVAAISDELAASRGGAASTPQPAMRPAAQTAMRTETSATVQAASAARVEQAASARVEQPGGQPRVDQPAGTPRAQPAAGTPRAEPTVASGRPISAGAERATGPPSAAETQSAVAPAARGAETSTAQGQVAGPPRAAEGGFATGPPSASEVRSEARGSETYRTESELRETQGFRERDSQLRESEALRESQALKESDALKESQAFKESERIAKSESHIKEAEGLSKSESFTKASEGIAKSEQIAKSESFMKASEGIAKGEAFVKEGEEIAKGEPAIKSEQETEMKSRSWLRRRSK